jgi:hypothetical protein
LKTAKPVRVTLPPTVLCDPHEFVLEKVMSEFDENETKLTKLMSVDKRFRAVKSSDSESSIAIEDMTTEVEIVPKKGVSLKQGDK